MTAISTSPFDPESLIPFLAYRRFLDDGEVTTDMVPTLAHFYESEKFRTVDESLRLAVLDTRTPKEARKFTKKRAELWRSDWKAVRGRVLRAGLAMQVTQSNKALKMAKQAFALSMELSAIKRIGGIPGAFLADELQRFFMPSTGPGVTKLGVIALNGCIPDDIESRLDALFSTEKPVSAAIYAGADADPRVEIWCARAAVPIRLTGLACGRIREENATEVTARVNALLTCMPASRKASVAILAAAAAKKPRIKVLDLSSTSPAAPPMVVSKPSLVRTTRAPAQKSATAK
jgi:predicted NAD-dependent protein-ADP-ribosyltransferase YbiA (DUF1768 family)